MGDGGSEAFEDGRWETESGKADRLKCGNGSGADRAFERIRALVARIVLGYSDNMTLKVFIHSADEGGYWAEVPALPGCVSQGETMDELRSNVREAIEGWLLAEDAAAKSISADEVIEVAV